MNGMQDLESTELEPRRMARRSLIKKSAAATAAAWAGAAVIDGIANPAAAASCVAGSYTVIYSSPSGVLTNLTTQGSLPGAAIAHTITPAATVPFTFSSNGFWHDVSGGANGIFAPITITVGNLCNANCYIESVYAAIHLKGFGACPAPYYYAAAAGSNYLNITAGSVGLSTSKTVTIQPSQTTTACTTASLHWGAPANTTSGNPGMPQVYENGFVIINVACT